MFRIRNQKRQRKRALRRGASSDSRKIDSREGIFFSQVRIKTFFLRRHSWNEAGKIFQKCSSLMTRNQKFWKMCGKIFQETLWVTTRFLEIFSRIWQYGLNSLSAGLFQKFYWMLLSPRIVRSNVLLSEKFSVSKIVDYGSWSIGLTSGINQPRFYYFAKLHYFRIITVVQ